MVLPANETLVPLSLENTGNDLASYRLSIVDDLLKAGLRELTLLHR